MSKKGKEIQMVVLRTINNNFELDTIRALLEQNKIPYVVRDHGVGGYLRIIGGDSFYGTDILVEELAYEKAEKILREFPWDGKD